MKDQNQFPMPNGMSHIKALAALDITLRFNNDQKSGRDNVGRLFISMRTRKLSWPEMLDIER